MDIIDRIFQLADAKYKEQKDFALAVGVSDDTVSNWRRRVSASCTKSKHLTRIAEVLGTTTDYLNYGAKTGMEHLAIEEAQLLAAYRKADEKSRAMVRLALGISGQEYIYLPPQGDDKYFCTPKDKSARIAARNGMIIKVPSPTSAEALDELSKATEKAAEKENDQY